jgi:hypothetical protein
MIENQVIIAIGGILLFMIIRPDKRESLSEIIARIKGYFVRK